MFTLTIRNLFAHKRRLLSTAFAVLLGVAFMAGTLVFVDSLTATFDTVLSDANGGVDAVVRAPSEVDLAYGQSGVRIDASTAELIGDVDGVADVAIQVTGYAQLVGPDGAPVGDQAQAPAFGMNWVDVDELEPYRITVGRPPAADHEIVIDRASAQETGYEPGDTVTVLTAHEPGTYTIAGIATFGIADSAAGAGAVLFTDVAAQQVLSAPGQVDGIAVTAADGVTQTDLAAAIDAALPADLEVVTGDQVVAEDQAAIDEAIGPFKVFMLVFAFIAVFVGAFIINNTFSISVTQRAKEVAVLRSLGAGRRQILCSVVLEAAITGAMASAVGLVAGIGVAGGIRRLIGGAGIDLPDGPLVVAGRSMLLAFAVGVAVTVVSAVLPARRAGRIRPIAALRSVAVEAPPSAPARTIAGGAITAAGVAALIAGLGGVGLTAVGLGAFTTLIGVAVLAPIAVGPVSGMLGWGLRGTGMVGQLATGNAARNPRRTARTASALMIGVALVAFIAVFSTSFKASVAGSIEDTFTGTHVIDSGVFDGRGGLSPELASELAGTAGIDVVSESRSIPAAVDGGGSGTLQAFTASTIAHVFDLGSVDGDLVGLGADGIAVHADTATAKGWRLGDSVPVALANGTSSLRVEAIYTDAQEWVGDQFVDVAAIDARVPGSLDSRMYVAGDEAAIAEVTATYPTADVLDADAFFEVTSSEIDQVLGIIYAMLALAIVIALLGVANTLSLSIFERTRELGLLRAVGMTRRQLRATIRAEAAIVAALGSVGGLGVGTFFGWATVRALESEGIDTFRLPVAQLVVIAAIAAFAGGLAATLPARRAARLKVLDALVVT